LGSVWAPQEYNAPIILNYHHITTNSRLVRPVNVYWAQCLAVSTAGLLQNFTGCSLLHNNMLTVTQMYSTPMSSLLRNNQLIAQLYTTTWCS